MIVQSSGWLLQTNTMTTLFSRHQDRAGQFTLVSLETFELQSVLCPELEPSVDLGERRILVYLAIAGDLAQIFLEIAQDGCRVG